MLGGDPKPKSPLGAFLAAFNGNGGRGQGTKQGTRRPAVSGFRPAATGTKRPCACNGKRKP
jgi:hypothetical protein